MLTAQLTRLRRRLPPGASEHLSLLSGLLRSSGIYALGSIGAPLVLLVLSPFLAHHLSATDYGIFAVLTTAISLSTGITQMGLGSAFFRAYAYDFASTADHARVRSTMVALLLSISALFALVSSLAAPVAAVALLQLDSRAGLVRIAAVAVICQNLAIPGLSWMRAENRAGRYVLLSLGNVVVNLCTTVLLVGVLRFGIEGALLGVAAGYAAIAFVTIPQMLVRSGVRIHADITWSMLSFGAPQVASVISIWILQLSDRYLLSHLTSYAETARYTVAYTLGSVLSVLILSPFTLAWPTTLYAIAKRADAPRVFSLIFHWFGLLIIIGAYGFSLVSVALLHVLFPRGYDAAAPVIPIVSLSMAFNGAYLMFTTGVSVRRRSPLVIVFTGIAAVVNVGLNLLLIPTWGALGAATATLIAYIVLAAVAYVANQRIYPIPFAFARPTYALCMCVVVYAGTFLIAQHIGGWFGAFLLFAGFALCCIGIAWVEWTAASTRARKMRSARAVQGQSVGSG